MPGVLPLTGEAALRVGAGKLQIATIETAALPLGMLVPDAGERLLRTVLDLPCDDDLKLVLDATLIGCAAAVRPALARFKGRPVRTPNHGEMAVLTGEDEEAIPDRAAAQRARGIGRIWRGGGARGQRTR